MESLKGKWHSAPFHDFGRKIWLVTFEVPEAPEMYDETKDSDLTISVKRYREKRSLNANAYFHVLVGKVADKLKISNTEVHNRMIADYGCMDEDVKTIILDDEVPWMKLESLHLKPTTATRVMDNGKLYRVYIVMRGSHTYDTKEMSRLIDGVVSEAKELGIETATPTEIERMKQQWKVS